MVRKTTSDDTKQTLRNAIDTYGQTMQKMVAIEELSELQKAITKYYRETTNPQNLRNVIEEMADVYIVLEELQMMYGIENWEIHNKIDEKVQRLKKRIKQTRKTADAEEKEYENV